MTNIRFYSAKAQVIDALRGEVQAGPSPTTRARLLARIETSVAALGGLAAATSGLGVNGASAVPASSSSAINGALGADPQVSMADRLAARLALKPATTLLSTLVLGGVLGALSHATLTSHKIESSKTARITGPTAVQLLEPPITTASPNEIVAITDLQTVPSVAHSTSTHSLSAITQTQATPAGTVNARLPVNQAESTGLAEQLALLETARRAVGHRDALAALQALSLHAERFPGSVLTEEREALTIKALVMANRLGEAKARAEKFESQFPNSLFMSSIRKSIRTIP